MSYYAPPLTDQDFNKQVGRYSQSIFQRNSSRALTATTIGNLVVWDNNKPVTKGKVVDFIRCIKSVTKNVLVDFISRIKSVTKNVLVDFISCIKSVTKNYVSGFY